MKSKESKAPVTPTTQQALEQALPWLKAQQAAHEHTRDCPYCFVVDMAESALAGVTPTPPTDPPRWDADFTKEPYMKISKNGEWVRFVDAAAPGSPTDPHWVSVTDRLPVPGHIVLTFSKGEIIDLGWLCDDKTWLLEAAKEHLIVKVSDNNVTYWHELPAAPGSTSGPTLECIRHDWEQRTVDFEHGCVTLPFNVAESLDKLLGTVGGDEVEGGATPQPTRGITCWHKEINDEGYCKACGTKAAIKLPFTPEEFRQGLHSSESESVGVLFVPGETADVWHEGSKSFYRATLLRKLEPEEVDGTAPLMEQSAERYKPVLSLTNKEQSPPTSKCECEPPKSADEEGYVCPLHDEHGGCDQCGKSLQNGYSTICRECADRCPVCDSSTREIRHSVSGVRRKMKVECQHPWHGEQSRGEK